MGVAEVPPARRELEPPEVPWRGRDAFFVLLLYVVALIPLAFFLEEGNFVGLLLAGSIVLAIVTLVWTRLYRGTAQLPGQRFRFGLATAFGGMLAGLVALVFEVVYSAIVVAALGGGATGSDVAFPTEFGSTSTTVLVVVTLVIVIPIVEEMFFRGFVLQGFARSYGPAFGVVVSAVLFGLAHIEPSVVGSVMHVGNTILVGLVFGALFVVFRNLAVTIIAHATINALAISTVLLAP